MLENNCGNQLNLVRSSEAGSCVGAEGREVFTGKGNSHIFHIFICLLYLSLLVPNGFKHNSNKNINNNSSNSKFIPEV